MIACRVGGVWCVRLSRTHVGFGLTFTAAAIAAALSQRGYVTCRA